MTKAAIDTSSDEPVIFYVDGATPPAHVPARDLHGNDLERIAYMREVAKLAEQQLGVRVAPGEEPPEPTRPHVTPSMVRAVHDELLAGEAFRATKPRKHEDAPDDGATDTEPAAPAPEG